MEKGGYVVCKPSNLFVLFVFWINILSVQCLGRRVSNNISSEPPSHLESHSHIFKNRLKRIILSIALGIITGLICALLSALIVRYFVKYMNTTKKAKKDSIVFSPRISPKTLKSALSNEPQLIGSSSSGKYYKAGLDNGLTVAVKRLELVMDWSHIGLREKKKMRRRVVQELEMLSCLRHRNLMSLRAYVCEPNWGCCLVYDYMANGSLEDAMRRVRDNELELKWESRLRIAVGIIKGLHYLHFTCEPRRLHCNLKPSNVLLGLEYEPRMADCGLPQILPGFCRAASGYNAPECFQNCSYSDKSDVYSFGVILGVLLTGRDPLDPFFGEASSGGSLGQWLRHLQQAGEANKALDKSILGEETEEDEMLMAVRIAAICLSDSPFDRPSSDELVSMLTQLNSF